MPESTAQVAEAGLRQEQYLTLLGLEKAISSHRNIPNLFRDLACRLQDLFKFRDIGVMLHDETRNVMRLYVLEACEDLLREPITEVPIEGSIAGWVWQNQEPIVVSDLDNETRFPFAKNLRPYPAKAVCSLPLTTAHQRLGTLNVWSEEIGAYDKLDLEFAQMVATQIAVAVDNAIHFQEAQLYQLQLARERDTLRVMLEVNNAVASHLDLREMLEAATKSLQRVMHFACLGVFLYESDRNSLKLNLLDFPGGRGLIAEDVEISLKENPTASPAGMAFTTREPVIMPLIDVERFPSCMARLLIAEGIKSGCSVPLISHGRALGVLNVGSAKQGAFTDIDCQLLSQVANQLAIAIENALAYREIDALKTKLEEEKLYLEEEISNQFNFREIIGHSSSLKRALQDAQTVAPTDSSVLIFGETGTGKELIARAIHNLSGRKDHTLVKVNCAAIPTGLLESEMFGHEKGAFTGAIEQRKGRFELANRGTLFLDEVEDIPPELQPKLLRVLQEQEFERLGSSRTIHVDVRVVAATNADLARLVADKKFRSDLYYRLNVFPISLPPLRERTEDIPLLVHFFAQKFAQRMKKPIERIPTDTVTALTRYTWPGNIRELQNLIERAVILSRGTVLDVPLGELKQNGKATERNGTNGVSALESVEREHILRVLRETHWVIGGPAGAAAILGLPRTTLNNKMHKLGISRPAPARQD
ncbi:MAG TPA: sigma 54-interacting transcriptional regulator [Pyrinomonadaceae bacterium]